MLLVLFVAALVDIVVIVVCCRLLFIVVGSGSGGDSGGDAAGISPLRAKRPFNHFAKILPCGCLDNCSIGRGNHVLCGGNGEVCFCYRCRCHHS